MKHTLKQGQKAKQRLIAWYKYQEIDFRDDEEGKPYLITSDSPEIYAYDVLRNIYLEQKYKDEEIS